MNVKKIIPLLFVLSLMMNFSSALYVDCGFRFFNGTSTVSVLCDDALITNSLRIYNGGTMYGLKLVDTTDSFATNLRIYTSSGVKALQRTYCEGSDDSGCGTIDCSGYYLQSGTESPNATETCYNKADITTDRCENFADCKDANTADCSSQSTDVSQYTCGSCEYISASSCTGTTLGSCSNYASGVNCLGICTQCDGSGSCANQVAGQDVHSDCGGVDCDGGATKYYNGWASNICYYKADESAAAHTCEGDGTCYDAADVCPANAQGLSTGVTRTTCKTPLGCSGTTAGSLGNVAAGLDTYGDCNGVDCDGGATKYYDGWASNICYYKIDESAAAHTCEGDGTCYDAADVCPANTKGLSTGVTRTTCKTQVGCSGTTAGSLGNVAAGLDTYGDCGGVSCSGYYVQTGTENPSFTEYCYNRLDEGSEHACEGDGTCYDAADVCPSNGADTARLMYTCGICKYISATSCTGTTLGSCTNYVSGTSCQAVGNCFSGTCGTKCTSYHSGVPGVYCSTWCNSCGFTSCVGFQGDSIGFAAPGEKGFTCNGNVPDSGYCYCV